MVDDERVLLVKPAVRLGLEFQTESAVDSLPGIDGTLVSGLPGDDASFLKTIRRKNNCLRRRFFDKVPLCALGDSIFRENRDCSVPLERF